MQDPAARGSAEEALNELNSGLDVKGGRGSYMTKLVKKVKTNNT
jgi:hypothetical protein